MTEDSTLLNPLNPDLEMLRMNKTEGFNYRFRRHEAWLENYTLYRDTVVINRLIQRQSVNLPLMKQSIRTLLKDVDDMPVLFFENLDNDKDKEIFQNEYWKWTVEKNNMELQDIVDKRQVFLFGRSFDQWQICDGMVKMTIQDPQDISVSRYTDPTNIHSSRYLIHSHIFRPLSELEEDEGYDKDALKRLRTWYGTRSGLIKAADNNAALQQKNQKMSDMGVQDINSPILGETYVELTMHFVYKSNQQSTDGTNYEEEQLWLFVEADDMEILMKEPLEKVIGVTSDHFWQNHFPYNTWADDVERQDFWSDGVADIIRTPNKVLNSYFSQLVENRTLRNFGMHYYDSTANEGFSPNTFNPVPFGWYPLPGKPADILQKVDIPDLSESLDEMSFIISMAEKATGATATQQGVTGGTQVTLGEIKLALGEAKERIKGMSKFYTPAWKARGEMFLKMIEAGADKLDAVKIYKKGKNTSDIYSREISAPDWMTKSGYQTRVWSQDEKNTEDTNTLQKLNGAKTIMPNNAKLDEIYKRKYLEFSGLTPDEINEIMALDQQQKDAVMSQMAAAGGQSGAMGGAQPAVPQLQLPQQAPAQIQ